MGDEDDRTPRWPSLVGRRVRLAQVDQDAEQWLFEVGGLAEVANRWRHLPGTVGRQRFHDELWAGVLAQFTLEHRETSDRLGHVMAYQANMSHGTASVAFMLSPGVRGLGWPIEGFLLFVDYLFSSFDLRKLYAEAAAFNLTQYGSAVGRFMCEEGRLRDHIFANGELHDVHVLAIYRDAWEEYAERLRPGP